jgi:epoxyqueuosine reductase
MQAHARPDLVRPDLLELLALDDAAFKAKFAGSPVLRTKRRGLLRNVCVVNEQYVNVCSSSFSYVLLKA